MGRCGGFLPNVYRDQIGIGSLDEYTVTVYESYFKTPNYLMERVITSSKLSEKCPGGIWSNTHGYLNGTRDVCEYTLVVYESYFKTPTYLMERVLTSRKLNKRYSGGIRSKVYGYLNGMESDGGFAMAYKSYFYNAYLPNGTSSNTSRKPLGGIWSFSYGYLNGTRDYKQVGVPDMMTRQEAILTILESGGGVDWVWWGPQGGPSMNCEQGGGPSLLGSRSPGMPVAPPLAQIKLQILPNEYEMRQRHLYNFVIRDDLTPPIYFATKKVNPIRPGGARIKDGDGQEQENK